MKYLKPFVAGVLLVTLGATSLVLSQSAAPKTLNATQDTPVVTSEITPQPTDQNTTTEVAKSTTTTAESPAPSEPASTKPSASDNKAKLKAAIEAESKSRKLSGTETDAQWFCLNRQVESGVGYDSYTDATSASKSPLVHKFLNPEKNADGKTTYIQFDGAGTCRIRLITS